MGSYAIDCVRFSELALLDCRWQLHGLVGHFAWLLLDIPFKASALCKVFQTVCWICDIFCS